MDRAKFFQPGLFGGVFMIAGMWFSVVSNMTIVFEAVRIGPVWRGMSMA